MVHGELIDKDGHKYIGGFKNGNIHGKGILKHRKVEFEGEYEDGELNGLGFIKFIDHDSLESFRGHFKHGKKNGFGIEKSLDGTTFYSEYKDNLQDGFTLKYCPKELLPEDSKNGF